MARWTYANVLSVETDKRRLWQFSPNDERFPLAREFTARSGETIPSHIAGKDWQSLWQAKLNIAWLPPEKVFLRALQLPIADYAETVSMIELQLEKISPLPVAQIVWTIEVLPTKKDNLQNVIVVVIPRNLVDDMLGQLEGQGFLADRLETPILDQLLATQANEDGVWIYPGETNSAPCLVAWWYGGVLRNITLLSWAGGTDVERLKEQLAQMSWAGELEGWLNTAPRWHLVADSATSAYWEPVVKEIAGEPVEVVAPLPSVQLAAASAKRAIRSSHGVTLLPPEYTTRYRQQFVDRLWMRGIFGVIMIYLAGVVIYFSALLVMKYQLNRVNIQLAGITPEFNATKQVKERVEILREQASLKLAALDCWKAASDNLPQELTLTSMRFQGGKSMALAGTVVQENLSKLNDYYEALGKTVVNGAPVSLGTISTPAPRPDKNGIPTIYWNFVCNLSSKGGGK